MCVTVIFRSVVCPEFTVPNSTSPGCTIKSLWMLPLNLQLHFGKEWLVECHRNRGRMVA